MFACRLFGSIAAAVFLAGASPSPSRQSSVESRTPVLRVSGRSFIDPAGRVVVLRGVNLSGGAKVPPFVALTDESQLDRLAVVGFNALRLVFIWEAYEPFPGGYDEAYLARMKAVARAAWERGLYVIVDLHQDGFSRSLSRGSGDGFPLWAVSSRATATTPDNGPRCKRWPILMMTDPGMHRSFSDFYADRAGVRSRYLGMVGRIAAGFAECPGVVGYDLMNEPWGDERQEIAPFHRDAVAAVRAEHPSAIMFIEGHVSTNTGRQTRLERPPFENMAYAPHYYHPATIFRNSWRGGTDAIECAFERMEGKAREWGVPFFLGEFGIAADADAASGYTEAIYQRLDEVLASGAQWNYCPTWNPRDKDGWNAEDFNIFRPDGSLRPNFADRPFPRKVAGTPIRFQFRFASYPRGDHSIEFTWNHDPIRGETEIYVPRRLFPRHSSLLIKGFGATCRRDETGRLLLCRASQPGIVWVRLSAE